MGISRRSDGGFERPEDGGSRPDRDITKIPDRDNGDPPQWTMIIEYWNTLHEIYKKYQIVIYALRKVLRLAEVFIAGAAQ